MEGLVKRVGGEAFFLNGIEMRCRGLLNSVCVEFYLGSLADRSPTTKGVLLTNWQATWLEA